MDEKILKCKKIKLMPTKKMQLSSNSMPKKLHLVKPRVQRLTKSKISKVFFFDETQLTDEAQKTLQICPLNEAIKQNSMN